jgi:H+/Cl- antiporter ClcA
MVPTVTDQLNRLAIAKLLAVCAALGVVVALVFIAFEELLHKGQHYLWVTVLGDRPSNLAIIGLTTVGGLIVGLAVQFLPGHGGVHPADSHNILAAGEDARASWLAGIFTVGLLGLCFGASLGPEGAVLPVAAGIAVLISRFLRVPGPMGQLVKAAGLGALLASMLGSPLAGLVPLMELIPSAALSSMAMLVLPSLTAGATAVLTLQVLNREPETLLPLEYTNFRGIHLLWAVLIGIVAGAIGMAVHKGVKLLRQLSITLDARSVVLSTTLGGIVLGLLYAVGGENVRFSGIPELLHLIGDADRAWTALAAMTIKVVATAVCVAAGYRGGQIFPVAFSGGATGLAIHLMFPSIPVPVAVGVGLAAAMATALGAPATAAIIVASLLSPTLLPLALVGIVSAHTVHILGAQLASERRVAAAQAAMPGANPAN